jgi:hypothetical protein
MFSFVAAIMNDRVGYLITGDNDLLTIKVTNFAYIFARLIRQNTGACGGKRYSPSAKAGGAAYSIISRFVIFYLQILSLFRKLHLSRILSLRLWV